MIWSILSSAFVIYLYRKLSAEELGENAQPQTAETSALTPAAGFKTSISAEIARLNSRISALESKLSQN